ncbi:SusC/RagA family TonB-linked outer membrane protein [Sphingobacterium kitahiroshimense]|uniref:SusC/RagA family TonB-linked outer membrane protein n=1 Tax=Sphingobacterium kitahiroshimense TaxID=470446 RepID=A0ABV0C0R5_9SPHI
MQKTCNRDSYVLYQRKFTVLNLELYFGLPSKTNQKINTLKSSILQIENVRHDYALQEHNQSTVSYIKIHWKLVLWILLSPMLHAFNLLLYLLKAIKVIAISGIMIIAVFHSLCLSAQTPRKDSGVNGQVKYELNGVVVSSNDGTPLQGVSVRINAENLQIKTSKDGKFQLTLKNQKGKIKFSSVGFKSQEFNYTAEVSMTVKLIPEDHKLEEVEVVSTGYQKIPKERATGSFEFVDNKLFNRKVSTDFISRLEDIVPGLAAKKTNSNLRGDVLGINIRGQSSLRSEIWPLLVVDGVPYENRLGDYGYGTFNNINPNDIENITVLKDAAASSIWGAKAGNGVIVITTKRAKFNENTSVSFNVNTSFKNKPNLYYYPQIGTSDYINLVQELFQKGRYDGDLDYFGSNPEPIVWMMKDQRDGKITVDELNAKLDHLRKIDMRDDFMKHIYRHSINQQYSVRLNTGGEKVNTSIGLGYDKNVEELVTSSYNRINLQSNTQIKPLKELLITLGITYTESNKNRSFIPIGYNRLARGVSNAPYMQLADMNGNPAEVYMGGLRPSFQDTLAGGRLLDWSYRPLKELHESNEEQINRDLMANLSMQYRFPFGLTINGLYAYQRNMNPITQWQGIGSYTQRVDINFYSSWDEKQVYRNMPLGDLYKENIWYSAMHQSRFSLEYDRTWNDHNVSALLGHDVRAMEKDYRVAQYFGFDPENGSFQAMHLGKEVPYLNGIFGTSNLPDHNVFQSFSNRFVSYFGNLAYTYKDRYIVSGSFRKDASNLFGVKTNDKGQPFWSIGGAWLLSKESFLEHSIFSLIKLRATYGYNGNVNTAVSAYPIMSISPIANSITGQNYGQISTPPNPRLRWERVGNMNLGFDFAIKGNRFSGAVEYYHKTPKDLIAPGQIDPSSGFSSLMMNTANLDTKGWDISLNTKPIWSENWEWNSNLVFANSKTMVTKAFLATDRASMSVSRPLSTVATPIEGIDLYSLLTYKWAGLDPEDGTPRSYLNGEISKDYFAITSTKVAELENHGSQIPVYFGSFRNTVRFKSIELSWNISYQLGHKFIRPSFDNQIFLNMNLGHPDYANRWQKPGDELITDVPAFTYPNNGAGSDVYRSSSVMVENAGQIKLRDIQCSLNLPQLAVYGFKNMRVYGYIQNVGTIWRGNKKGIDPEYGNWIPDPLMCSLGLNFNL